MRNINYIFQNRSQFNNKSASSIAKTLSSGDKKFSTSSGSVAESTARKPRFSDDSISSYIRSSMRKRTNTTSMNDIYRSIRNARKGTEMKSVKRVMAQLVNYNYVNVVVVNSEPKFAWNRKMDSAR
jgi:hypothetical protein